MSVIIETSLGDLTVDLSVDESPLACQNFLKLCKIKYYNNASFHRIERDFVAVVEQHDYQANRKRARHREEPDSPHTSTTTARRRRRKEGGTDSEEGEQDYARRKDHRTTKEDDYRIWEDDYRRCPRNHHRTKNDYRNEDQRKEPVNRDAHFRLRDPSKTHDFKRDDDNHYDYRRNHRKNRRDSNDYDTEEDDDHPSTQNYNRRPHRRDHSEESTNQKDDHRRDDYRRDDYRRDDYRRDDYRRDDYRRDDYRRGVHRKDSREHEGVSGLREKGYGARRQRDRDYGYGTHEGRRNELVDNRRRRQDSDVSSSGSVDVRQKRNRRDSNHRLSEERQLNHSALQVRPGGPTIWELINTMVPFDPNTAESRWVSGLPDENSKAKHDLVGVLATANERHNANGAFFYLTLAANLESLDGKHTVFGRVVEGLESVLLGRINRAVLDDYGRPLAPIRIRHTLVVDDPFPDPPHLSRLIPSRSPSLIRDASFRKLEGADDEMKVMEKISQTEARSRAIALEIIGDIPDADMRPPENVLFVCKLNPYTEEEDLETIFKQFGSIRACNIIKDWKTGDSLQYGFIEFEDIKSAETAYFKMQDVLIDDRRIHVAFCQSVSRQFNQWRQQGAKGTTQDAIEMNRLVQQYNNHSGRGQKKLTFSDWMRRHGL